MLDIDYHHGNGQQEIFYTRSDVLTVSIHGHPSFAYPYFSGFRDETGIGPGAGYNLNLPLPEHITPEQHRNAVAEALAPHPPLRPCLPRGLCRLRHRARRSDRHLVQSGARFRAARPHARRAGLLDPHRAGGRLPRAHARHQCAQFLRRPRHRPFGRAPGGAGARAERRPAPDRSATGSNGGAR